MSKAGIKKKKSPERKEGHVEILGDGQYFVAYNIHPKTEKEYAWSTSPHEIKAEDLPLLSEEDVEHLFKSFKESTTPVAKDKKASKPFVKGKNNNNRRYTNREITAFLSCCGEEFTNGSHDEWIPVVMAVHHETQGSNEGKELARRWSKRGSTYDEENFNYKWGTFVLPEEMGEDEQKKKCSTFASLLYHHRKLIPDGLPCDRFTDTYSSALFSICNRGNYIYVESLGGWFVRKKNLWFLMCESKEKICGAVHRFLVECREDRNDLEDWSEARKIAEKEIARSTGIPAKKSPRDVFKASFKSEKVEGMAKAKSISTLLEASGSFFIDPDRVGCDKRYIGDGYDIVDLETGKRIDYSSKLIIIKTTKTLFVDGEPSKEFFDFVSQYFENQELMNFFARCVGMALYGRNEAQVLVNFLGDGGTGKSTLTNLIELAFGSQYVSHLPFKDLASPYEGDSDTPALVSLMLSGLV